MGSEENGSKGDDKREACHDGIAVSKALGDISVDEQPNYLPHICTLFCLAKCMIKTATEGAYVAETGLPWRCELIGAIGLQIAVLLVELWETIYTG